MTFNSVAYIGLLIAVVVVHASMRHAFEGVALRRGRQALLLITSYGFYAAWSWRFLGLIALSTIVDFVAARRIETVGPDDRRRDLWLGASVAVNIGALATFKYSGFFLEEAQDLAARVGLTLDVPTMRFLLPVGISFYTFQTLGYTIDVHRRRQVASRSPLEFALFVVFFPQLVAGPIERSTHLLPQLATLDERRVRLDDVARWIGLIVVGLVRKVFIADQLAPVVQDVFAHPERWDRPAVALAAGAFAVQVYCDFAGYTDIARGSARLLGIDLSHNFRQPLLSRDPTDFWRRWHITLGGWFRDYVYIPLGGNRAGALRTDRNLLIVFALVGLWHGAATTFVIWGLLHGAALVVHRHWPSDVRLVAAVVGTRVSNALAIAASTTFFALTMVVFRSSDLGAATDYLGALLDGAGSAGVLGGDQALCLVLMAASFGIDARTRAERRSVRDVLERPWRAGALLGTSIVAVIIASGADTTPFIYFQF